MNEEAKKKILRQIPYGLYVIGVKDAAGVHAFTGSWLTQCSMKPPRLALGVRHETHSLASIRQHRVFTVNWMSRSDQKVLEQFFKATPANGNRFGEVAYQTGRTGAPLLDRALAYVECEVKDIHEAGDHSIVIGEVVEADVRGDERPLIMSDTPWHYGG